MDPKKETVMRFSRDRALSLALVFSLDLAKDDDCRNGSYAYNWYPLADNPWRGDRVEGSRREAAQHILALNQLGKETP